MRAAALPPPAPAPLLALLAPTRRPQRRAALCAHRPNWFVNLASPIVGNPLLPFFIGSLFGTQGSLLFLAICGNTLANFGEAEFEKIRSPLTLLSNPREYFPIIFVGAIGASLQFVPIYLINQKKKQKAAAAVKAD